MIPPLTWKMALRGVFMSFVDHIVENLETIFIMIGGALLFFSLHVIAAGAQVCP